MRYPLKFFSEIVYKDVELKIGDVYHRFNWISNCSPENICAFQLIKRQEGKAYIRTVNECTRCGGTRKAKATWNREFNRHDYTGIYLGIQIRIKE